MIIELQQINNELRRRNQYIRNIGDTPFYYNDKIENLEIGEKQGSGVINFVLSPLLALFTIWVLQEAKKNNVTKLFFLARDGYPVYRMAKKICLANNLEIECKYFYCSRYSLRIPMYSENIDEALDYVCRNSIEVTFRKIMIRSGFSDELIEDMQELFADVNFDDALSYPDLKRVRTRLAECPAYINELRTVSEKKWRLLQAYCKQEGILEKDNIGIVDSGWTGTTQKSICHIRKRCGCNSEICGYYFGLFEKPKDKSLGRYSSFYFDQHGHIRNKVMFSNCLFETLFSADHGTTSGYIENEAVIPVLGEYESNTKRTKIMNFFENYGDWFVSEHQNLKIDNFPVDRYRRAIEKNIHLFMWDPTDGEATEFGTMKFSDDLLDHTCREVAPKFSDEILRESHFLNKVLTAYGFRRKHIHESAWYEGSVARNGKNKLFHKISNSVYKTLRYLTKELSEGLT